MLLLALLGATAIGLLLGLTFRGLVVLGDRRQLSVLSEQLRAEHDMGMATSAAIARMRAAVRDQLRH